VVHYSLMESFPRWIEQELDKRGWRQSDLARRAGLSEATLSRILNGSRKAGPETCVGIAAALEVPPEHVFRIAGLLPPLPSPVEEEQEALGLFRSLDRQMRGLALGILRALGAGESRRAPGGGHRAAAGEVQAEALSRRLAREIAADLAEMPPEDQQRVFDLIQTLSGHRAEGARQQPREGRRGAEEMQHVPVEPDSA
jgi:transcriptional regulator with XRE-family HTH domain